MRRAVRFLVDGSATRVAECVWSQENPARPKSRAAPQPTRTPVQKAIPISSRRSARARSYKCDIL